MRGIIMFLILTTTLTSCDQLNSAYLKNKSGKSISASLYFFNYNPADTDGIQNTYIKHLMKDSIIKNNVKLTLLRSKIARVNFILLDNSTIELIYDTAPLREETVEFDAIKIISNKNKIELLNKEEILNSFKPKTNKTIRYLTISE